MLKNCLRWCTGRSAWLNCFVNNGLFQNHLERLYVDLLKLNSTTGLSVWKTWNMTIEIYLIDSLLLVSQTHEALKKICFKYQSVELSNSICKVFGPWGALKFVWVNQNLTYSAYLGEGRGGGQGWGVGGGVGGGIGV